MGKLEADQMEWDEEMELKLRRLTLLRDSLNNKTDGSEIMNQLERIINQDILPKTQEELEQMSSEQLREHIMFLQWQSQLKDENILHYREEIRSLKEQLLEYQKPDISVEDQESSDSFLAKRHTFSHLSVPKSHDVLSDDEFEPDQTSSILRGKYVPWTSSPNAPLPSERRKQAFVQMGQRRGYVDELHGWSGSPDIVVPAFGHLIETSDNNAKSFFADNIQYYQNYVMPYENQLTLICKDTPSGAGIISLVKVGDTYRVILRTKEGDQYLQIPKLKYEKANWKSISQKIIKEITPALASSKWALVSEPKIKEDLEEFENLMTTKKFKVGVLLAREGQKREEEMFSNGTTKAFSEFLAFLGEKIALRGWEKYAGGLDVKKNTTGTHSIYRTYKDNEIIFHVSTMLPFSNTDPQQVERKRHLGNDIVLLVFLDGSTPYKPSIISSNFIHITIIIQPYEVDDGKTLKYRVGVTYRDTVSEFLPCLPDPPIFKKDEAFLDFLLSKIINAELACYRSEKFVQKLQATRGAYLEKICRAYSK